MKLFQGLTTFALALATTLASATFATAANAKKLETPNLENAEVRVDDYSFTLKWDAVPNAVNYRVYYQENGKATLWRATTKAEYTHYGAVKNTEYTLWVVAQPKWGYEASDASAQIVVPFKVEASEPEPEPTVEKLATPILLTKQNKNGYFELTWEPVENAASYQIWYNEPGVAASLWRSTTEPVYRHYGALEKEYEVWVVAIAKSGFENSDPSASTFVNYNPDDQTVYPVDGSGPVPPTPKVPEIVNGGRLADEPTTIKLEWNAVEGATGYVVYNVMQVSDEEEPIYEEVAATDDAETLTATVSGFDADATWCFAVVAFFEDGTDAESELFEVGPDTICVEKIPMPVDIGETLGYNLAASKAYTLTAFLELVENTWTFEQAPTVEFQFCTNADPDNPQWVSYEVVADDLGGMFVASYNLSAWDGVKLEKGDYYGMRARVKSADTSKYKDSPWLSVQWAQVLDHNNGNPLPPY